MSQTLPPGMMPPRPGMMPQQPVAPPQQTPPPNVYAGLPSPPAQPPAPPRIPNLTPPGIRPTGIPLASEQMLAFLLPPKEDGDAPPPDPDDALPPSLRQYAAGLRPSPRPEGTPWQQEIVYERLGRTDAEIAAVARFYFEAARNYDEGLSRQRMTASRYYRGEADGPLPEGRSQLVMTVVRDTIRATMPSLLRIFTGVEDPVSFSPVADASAGTDDQLSTKLSRQATDYARWALFDANPGWTILHDCLLEALTRKAGWVRWHWGKRKQIRNEVCEGLLASQLAMLLSEPGVTATRIVRRPMTKPEQTALAKTPEGQMYLQSGGPPEMWAATITRSAAQSWPIVESVPAECVWIVSDAGTVQSARAVFHVRDTTVSDLIEAGLPPAKILAHRDASMTYRQQQQAAARDRISGDAMRGSPPGDKSMSLVRYAEGWVRTDTDGDNRAELIHVHLLGNGTDLIQWERVDEIPLACFVPYREPGRVIGSSQADMVMDLQRTESRVMRAVLDSLGQSMFPRTVMTMGQVNMADVKQTAIGSIIRVAQQGAVSELTKPFMGKEALPILEILEAVRESRTGITRTSAGLTIDELQSTTPSAVSQQVSAAQDRLDMVARTLAETGLAPLYMGLLKMLARHQDRPNVLRIKGSWVPIDPRALATQWETSVNVGGKGLPAERLAMLAQVAAKQEMIIQTGGMGNPLVGLPEYRNTLARMLEVANIADTSSYFRQLPPGFQPPPTPQPPNTDLILAQISAQKNASDLENTRADQQTKRAQLLLDDDRERDKAALDGWTKAWTASAQFGTPAPSLTDFQNAMRRAVPTVQLLGDLPPPTSPQPAATDPNSPQQQIKQQPQPPMGMPPRGPQQPLTPPNRPMQPSPTPMPNPAVQQAMRAAMAGRGPPSAYGQIAQRAMASPLNAPGGPPLPGPNPTPGQR